MDFKKINYIIQKFFINSKVLNINIINSGLVNKTYVVEHLYNGIKSKFILQSLSNIFESHEIVNMNHKLVTDHMMKQINNSSFDFKRWEVPNLIKCKSNNLFSFSFNSVTWRAMEYIEDAFTLDSLEDEKMAYQTGIGMAKFHSICSDLDCSEFENSIDNFHNTKYFLDQYIKIIKDFDFARFDKLVNERIHNLINCLSNHVEYIYSLLLILSKKKIDYNVIHGDPKLSNFLFDIQYKYVVSLIDLDTVSSGFCVIDLADCIRSISNLAGEEPENIEKVVFDINSVKYFLQGYFSIFNKNKSYSFRFLPEFIYLIIFELTIRFLIDFLQSNRYFEIKYETHNLFRSEVQYRLLTSFLVQIPKLSSELHDIGISSSSTFVSDVQKFV